MLVIGQCSMLAGFPVMLPSFGELAFSTSIVLE